MGNNGPMRHIRRRGLVRIRSQGENLPSIAQHSIAVNNQSLPIKGLDRNRVAS